MKFVARNYENILLDYRFIRAIGVQLNIKSEPNRSNEKDVIHSVDPAVSAKMVIGTRRKGGVNQYKLVYQNSAH